MAGFERGCCFTGQGERWARGPPGDRPWNGRSLELRRSFRQFGPPIDGDSRLVDPTFAECRGSDRTTCRLYEGVGRLKALYRAPVCYRALTPITSGCFKSAARVHGQGNAMIPRLLLRIGVGSRQDACRDPVSLRTVVAVHSIQAHYVNLKRGRLGWRRC